MQRKVFRIEQMLAPKRTAPAVPPALTQFQPRQQSNIRSNTDIHGLTSELAWLRNTLAGNRRDLARLIGDGMEQHTARAADELGAAVDGMEHATQKILKAVEVIDDSAKALTASLRDEYKRGVAQDIQDCVVEIYESCNFQDIAGQRIEKAIGTLIAIEQQVVAMLARLEGVGDGGMRPTGAALPAGRGLLNGPKLDGDTGHASQHDIDKMFGCSD